MKVRDRDAANPVWAAEKCWSLAAVVCMVPREIDRWLQTCLALLDLPATGDTSGGWVHSRLYGQAGNSSYWADWIISLAIIWRASVISQQSVSVRPLTMWQLTVV